MRGAGQTIQEELAMKAKRSVGLVLLALAASGALAQAKVAPPSVVPETPRPIVFRPTRIKADEKPVVVETAREVVADNGLFQRVETTITFTNPNARVFEGELELPIPDGATVCGYALEVNGAMVPGVVCEKEEARTAFDNEIGRASCRERV